MSKRIVLAFLSIFCISMSTYSMDAWIRINQLGYLPNAQKRAVLISEAPQDIKQFTIHDALTNEVVATLHTVIPRGEFSSYKSTYILDFSGFHLQGAFYIKAGFVYSPTIYINNSVYLGKADILLNYLRLQRCDYYPSLYALYHGGKGYLIYGNDQEQKITPTNPIPEEKTYYSYRGRKEKQPESQPIETSAPRFVDVTGGWHDASDYLQFGSTTANAVFQMLFAYQMNPTAFADTHNAIGEDVPNKIPDILDEAKWGLDWLLKMYPSSDTLFFQIIDDSYHSSFSLSYEEQPGKSNTSETKRSIFMATGKPQGLFDIKNQTSGIASIAGKYASAFALGSDLLAEYYPEYADTLVLKATNVYEFGKMNPGTCQTVPGKSSDYQKEENWTDDMELAAAELYRLTYDSKYLRDAASYGRTEPITPWMCSDTTQNYQWYPYINLGHFMLANLENPRFQKEFLQNMISGIHRMSLRAVDNPFNMGVPLVKNSNNMVVALATQCMLYRNISKDSTYLYMETALTDWLFGCNPWGTSMVIGMPQNGTTPSDPHSDMWMDKRMPLTGGLINGPVYESVFKKTPNVRLSKADTYKQFQSPWAVYHDDHADFVTNEPTLDGTASLTYLLSGKQMEVSEENTSDKNEYEYGGIVRTDPSKKQICLIFTGNEYADGYETIRQTLKSLDIKASFFFTGDFYRNPQNAKLIKGLMEDKHFLGANSDKHILYCSWKNRDSLYVDKTTFLNDLRENYKAMDKFGIKKSETHFFLPPFGMYNNNISEWCKEIGLYLVNSTPGSYSNADYTIPEMRENYFSSIEIYNRILLKEAKDGLNGNILQFSIGTDKRRTDKFYPQLYSLLLQLSRAGYDFVTLDKATGLIDDNVLTIGSSVNKQERKN